MMYIFKRLFYFLFLEEHIKYTTLPNYACENFNMKFLFAYFRRYGIDDLWGRCRKNKIKHRDISITNLDKIGEPIITVTKKIKIGLFYFKVYVDISKNSRSILNVGLVKYKGNREVSSILKSSMAFYSWKTYVLDVDTVMDMVKDKIVYSKYEGVDYKLGDVIYSDYHKSYIKRSNCLSLENRDGDKSFFVHKNHIVYSKIHKANIIKKDSKYIKEYNDYVLKDCCEVDVPIKEVVNILNGLKSKSI